MNLHDEQKETAGNLLIPDEYFARYGAHLATAKNGREAWENTERDLFRDTGLRRFRSYDSFRVKFSEFRAGTASGRVTFFYTVVKMK